MQKDENDFRYERSRPLEVYNRRSGVHLGHVESMSLDEFTIVAQQPLDPGGDYHLRIQWDADAGWGETIEADARCTFCRRTSAGAYFDAGFVWINPAQEVMLQIQRILDDESGLHGSEDRRAM